MNLWSLKCVDVLKVYIIYIYMQVLEEYIETESNNQYHSKSKKEL